MIAVYAYLLCCSSPVAARTQAVIYADSLLSALPRIKNDTGKVNVLLSVSRSYKTSNVTKEFYYAGRALGLSERIGWAPGIMYAEQLIGESYNSAVGYNEAVQHLKLSLALARKLQRTDVEAACLKTLVFASYKMNRLNDMVFYQKALLELAGRIGDPAEECMEMNTYALRLSDAGYYKKAIRYWQQDIAFAKKHFTGLQKDEMLASILNTLACTYVKTHQADSALYCLRNAAHLIKPTNNNVLKAYITSTICDVYEDINRYDSAQIYGLQTVKWGQILKNLDLQQHYTATLSRVYEADHKPAMALIYLKQFDSLINIISNTGKTVEQAMQLARINLEQQEDENRLEARSFETVRRNQQFALVSVFVALVALITLTIFIYRNLRQKQKANKIISLQAIDLKAQNEIIDLALKEKETLLKETHHRVKNNLQLVSSLLQLQTENMADEAAKNALLAAQRRVLSIATVHSKLYGSEENEAIEFSAFASDLVMRLNSAFGNSEQAVHFTNRIPVTYLPLDTVVLLGLILNELITNSYKHAFKEVAHPTITATMEDTGRMFLLRYSDNGPGLSGGAFDQPSSSLGLYIVKRLSKQLKGTATYSSDNGSTFTIIFPHATS